MDSIYGKLSFCPLCVGLISQELLQVMLCNSKWTIKKKKSKPQT